MSTSAKPKSHTNQLPRRIRVKETLSGRYEAGSRPVSWDDRRSGVEKIIADNGETITLYSNGGQSTPAPGWELLLTKEANDVGEAHAVHWTVYGMARHNSV